MKGKITIEATEEGLHVSGEAFYNHKDEVYEVMRALSLSLGINSPEKWAELVVYCVPRLSDKGRKSNSIEIRIPNIEGE